MSNILWKLGTKIFMSPAFRFKNFQSKRYEARLVETLSRDLVVRDGPFKGLKYDSSRSFGSTLIPKLLGTYETELHPFFRQIESLEPSLIIDIGCAEGYYAVGLSRKFPKARVLACDISKEARDLTIAMAKANEVEDRVEVQGEVTVENILELSFPEDSLLISDCEGFEESLFTDIVCSHLVDTRLVIEVHDRPRQGLSQMNRILNMLVNRVGKTHMIELVHCVDDEEKPRLYESEYVSDDSLERYIAFSEDRPSHMVWIIAYPVYKM